MRYNPSANQGIRMIIESNSDIIVSTEARKLGNGQAVELLHFRDGKVLALSHNAMALYQNSEAIEHPLGQGLMASSSFAEGFTLEDQQGQWVESYKAGFVGLHDGSALLITPISIQLFPNRQDALHNRNEIAKLMLEQ
jgi:hypothetical protein